MIRDSLERHCRSIVHNDCGTGINRNRNGIESGMIGKHQIANTRSVAVSDIRNTAGINSRMIGDDHLPTQSAHIRSDLERTVASGSGKRQTGIRTRYRGFTSDLHIISRNSAVNIQISFRLIVNGSIDIQIAIHIQRMFIDTFIFGNVNLMRIYRCCLISSRPDVQNAAGIIGVIPSDIKRLNTDIVIRHNSGKCNFTILHGDLACPLIRDIVSGIDFLLCRSEIQLSFGNSRTEYSGTSYIDHAIIFYFGNSDGCRFADVKLT